MSCSHITHIPRIFMYCLFTILHCKNDMMVLILCSYVGPPCYDLRWDRQYCSVNKYACRIFLSRPTQERGRSLMVQCHTTEFTRFSAPPFSAISKVKGVFRLQEYKMTAHRNLFSCRYFDEMGANNHTLYFAKSKNEWVNTVNASLFVFDCW